MDYSSVRRDKVKGAFLHSWSGYKKYAWGKDELKPLTNSSKEHFQSWGATIVDSLTTLWLMDLKEEFKEAVQVVEKIDFNHNSGPVNFFETTIRYLGGLIGAYDLSGEKVLLRQAITLADNLMIAFDSKSGLPYNSVYFTEHRADRSYRVSLAEIGTCQLEFVRLSQITGDRKYAQKAMRVIEHLDKLKKPHVGLYPLFLGSENGNFISKEISFGAMGDSFYEYLIKLYMLTGKKDARLKRMYLESVEGFKSLVINGNDGFTYFSKVNNYGEKEQKIDHLALFMGGLLQYGDFVLNSKENSELGLGITKMGYQFHNLTATKLAPEIIRFSRHGPIEIQDTKNNLRPEFIESLFYSYRFTRDGIYRDQAWEIFKAFEKYSKTGSGYATYANVNDKRIKMQQLDEVESFFFAETLKYLYLIFSPESTLDFNKYVLNTEAHPIKLTMNWY
ncbi:glycoside hydrolase family 47 protein [Conidiobolus coronatus NRRL 28638]|uniref:alpha-1,2-Mannosidase n=1 Tax=Conidiobolus coronatus (strain ATCC 28846 / CBS 209.66 / NRRL 28638) TaxID=796925 RepID=A0A137P970_CONC2|nr:glycoside hydrolase family 47 protein [Conidiobolus coronatus NRRL 28638]|eukprot:KXN71494.1 glycoside hydrolase family 47 protein [Conidiobolus coronatus NRRL 28638]